MKLADPKVQTDWLVQHVPHRIRAALTWTNYLEKTLPELPLPPDQMIERAGFFSGMAVWEGKHAAMRWLIEFIGITSNDSGEPNDPRKVRKKKQKMSHARFDVDITDLPGGEYFDHTNDDAKFLARIWKGCSQATGHPTHGSKHPSISKPELEKALLIVMNHLRQVYAAGGQNLQSCVFKLNVEPGKQPS
jgi:hypothetical protein